MVEVANELVVENMSHEQELGVGDSGIVKKEDERKHLAGV